MTRQKPKYKRVSKKRREKDEALLKENEFTKLQRKLRIMDNDRKNYAQDVTNILRKQGREIDMLEQENSQMFESLSVAYGKFHLEKDIENTKRLKELLAAREDYDRLAEIESNSCKELDVKIGSLRAQLAAMKRQMGGEEADRDREINLSRYVQKLENRVNKLTTDFCGQLYNNEQMKEKIKVLMKEKKIYEELYNKLTERIAAYKKKIMDVTQEASIHYEHRLEAMSKMKTLKERSSKDESMFQAEMKILQRMIAHDTKLKEFMSTKENERLNYKAEEAEKRAKMSVKEKALNEETQHVQKFENLFENVREVTGHADLERVVHEFTSKDEENFSRFDYVSELNHDVEKLRENIQLIRDNIKRLKEEDAQMVTGCEKTLIELKRSKAELERDLSEEEAKQVGVDEKLEIVCGAVHLLFKRISCNTDSFRASLAFEDRVVGENLKMYLGIIEQRFMELVCILKFIGLHQDHHGNLLRTPRSIHRIRPRGPSKILLAAIDQPVMPSVNTPNISDEISLDSIESDDSCLPMDIETLREKAMKKIAKKEAAGLLNQPLFAQDKRKPKSAKKK